MPEPSEIQRDLQTLESDLKKLEAEYNMFFSGRAPRPPWETRKRVRGAGQALGSRSHRDGRAIASAFRRCRLASRNSSSCGIAACARGKKDGPGRSPSRRRKRAPKKERQESSKVLYVTAFKDPMHEMDKLHSLYDTLMDARRQAGDDVVPFHRFAALVKDQVTKLRDSGKS